MITFDLVECRLDLLQRQRVDLYFGMADELYDLVFRGEVLEGQHAVDVRLRLGRVLRQDADRVAMLFSGKPVVIKRAVPRAVAAQYQAAFRKAGARLRVRALELPGSEQASQPAPQAGAAGLAQPLEPSGNRQLQAVESPPTADEGSERKSLAERLAEVSTSAMTMTDANLEDLLAGPEAENLAGDFEVAPEGAPVLLEHERQRQAPVRVNTAGLSLADPGEALGVEREFEPLELDLSEFSVAEVGSDMGPARDYQSREVDTSGLSLAPPGGEIEGLPRPPAPAPPDTSHLHLEDQ